MTNAPGHSGAQVRRLLGRIRAAAAQARTAKQVQRATALDHFVKVTHS